MKLGWRDATATVLFGAVAVVYAFYFAWGGISFIEDSSGATSVGILDPTGMSGLALIVGALAAIAGGWIAFNEGTVARYVTGGLGAVSLIVGVLALTGENIFSATVWEYVLGGFMASLALLWAMAIVRHAGVGEEQRHAPSMTPA